MYDPYKPDNDNRPEDKDDISKTENSDVNINNIHEQGASPEQERRDFPQYDYKRPDSGPANTSGYRADGSPASGQERNTGYYYRPDGYAAQERPGYQTQKRERYADAGYITQSEASPIPPTPYTPYTERTKPVRKRRGISMAAVVALCLAFAILGGAAGSLVTSLINDTLPDDSAGDIQVTDGLKDLPDDTDPEDEQGTTPNAATATTPVLSGNTGEGVLSGTDIYALACTQTVGITTEITTSQNYFGQATSGSVSGSGFVVSEDGYILTNYHVIETAYKGGYDIEVMFYDGTTYIATVVGVEEDNDIAVLKIDANGLSAAALGDSTKMQVGETIYAVGNPLGELNFTMTTGCISALDRELSSEDGTTTINMFQIDAAVNSGNSGGPVYNSRGEIIGIVTAKYSYTGVEGLGFAIPVNDAIDIANELITQGYVSGKPEMGIGVQTVSSSVAQYYNMVVGAYIYTIESGSCADIAGLQVGDIITKIDDTVITTSSELIAAKKSYRAGDTATLTVYRSGQYLELEITFDEEKPDSDTTSSDQTQPGGQSGQTVPRP